MRNTLRRFNSSKNDAVTIFPLELIVVQKYPTYIPE